MFSASVFTLFPQLIGRKMSQPPTLQFSCRSQKKSQINSISVGWAFAWKTPLG